MTKRVSYVRHHVVRKLSRVDKGPASALFGFLVDDVSGPGTGREEESEATGIGVMVHDMDELQVIGLDQSTDLLFSLSGRAYSHGLAVFKMTGRQAELPVGPAGVAALAEQDVAPLVAKDDMQVNTLLGSGPQRSPL